MDFFKTKYRAKGRYIQRRTLFVWTYVGMISPMMGDEYTCKEGRLSYLTEEEAQEAVNNGTVERDQGKLVDFNKKWWHLRFAPKSVQDREQLKDLKKDKVML